MDWRGFGFAEGSRGGLMVLVPGVELASCRWLAGFDLGRLAGGGPPCSTLAPCWDL